MVTDKQLRAAGRAYDAAEPALEAINASGLRIYRFARENYYLWDGQTFVDLNEPKAVRRFMIDSGFLREKQTRQWYVMDIILGRLKPCARIVDPKRYQTSHTMKRIGNGNVNGNTRGPISKRRAMQIIEELEGDKNDKN